MKWFKEVKNLEELRKIYKKLVIKHHPDNGGSENVIKEINAEYDKIFKQIKSDFEHQKNYSDTSDKQKQSYDWEKDVQIRNMILKISKFKDITIEIIGVWIWVSNCYAYRKELKELGFHWARQKQMWYIHFDDFHKFGSKPMSMEFIRCKYGSIKVNVEREDAKSLQQY